MDAPSSGEGEGERPLVSPGIARESDWITSVAALGHGPPQAQECVGLLLCRVDEWLDWPRRFH
jgi:hypothetical protein